MISPRFKKIIKKITCEVAESPAYNKAEKILRDAALKRALRENISPTQAKQVAEMVTDLMMS